MKLAFWVWKPAMTAIAGLTCTSPCCLDFMKITILWLPGFDVYFTSLQLRSFDASFESRIAYQAKG